MCHTRYLCKKICQQLGLESLKSGSWNKRLSCMFKIMNTTAPNYLLNLFPKSQQTITTRNNHMTNYHCRTDCFKYSFFPSTLNASIRNSETLVIFKSRLLSFILPIQSNVYNILGPIGLQLLTRFRLGCSHLNEHKFRHNFQDCLNLLFSRSLEIEDTVPYLLHCHHFSHYCFDLINSVKSVSHDFEFFSDNVKRDILLYGDSRFDTNKNKLILEATIIYIKNTERFSGSLFG